MFYSKLHRVYSQRLTPVMSPSRLLPQRCDAARGVYREAGAVNILEKFRAVNDKDIMCAVHFSLAYIVTEEENDKINNDDNNLAFIIELLRQVIAML